MRPSASSVLRDAVEAAWQRAASARESQAGRRRAEADAQASRRLWAAPPSIELAHRDDRLQSNAGRRETEVAVSWPLWLPGQRSATEELARAAVDRAATFERASRLDIAGLVRENAWQGVAAAAEYDQLGAHVDVLRKLYDDVARRVAAGDLARADALAAQAEWLAMQVQAGEAAQRLEQSRVRWRELTGLGGPPSAQAITEAPEPSERHADHPELHAAAQAVAHARRRLDLVRSSVREAPELKLGMRQDVSGGLEGTHHSLSVGIRVPLGTKDRNLPLVVGASTDLDVAQAIEQRLRARVDADVQIARAALDAAQRQLAVENERAGLLHERASLMERSFRAGETALPDLLRALDASSQASSAVARQKVFVGRAGARLQQAMGILP